MSSSRELSVATRIAERVSSPVTQGRGITQGPLGDVIGMSSELCAVSLVGSAHDDPTCPWGLSAAYCQVDWETAANGKVKREILKSNSDFTEGRRISIL